MSDYAGFLKNVEQIYELLWLTIKVKNCVLDIGEVSAEVYLSCENVRLIRLWFS